MYSEDCFMVAANVDTYDSYFQQFLIGKLYAVVGMRYHSNIFSAKMGTPFISISYEQKMKGFIKSVGLDEYCIDINNLEAKELEDRYNMLVDNYEEYKDRLKSLHCTMKEKSYETTAAVIEILERKTSGE